MACRPRPTDLLGRHELEVNPVIDQQAQAAVPRVFDGDGSFGPHARLQQQRRLAALRHAELFGQAAARPLARGVAVDDRGQARPHVGAARPTTLVPAQGEEARQHLGPAGDTRHRQAQRLLGQGAQLRFRRTVRLSAGGRYVGVRPQPRRQSAQAE